MAATGWTALITLLSLIPLSGTPAVKSPVPDKAVHLVFYFFFTFFWYRYLRNRNLRHALLLTFLCALMYGTIIEALQYMMPFGRSFDTRDILANAAGAFLSALLSILYKRISGKALRRKN